MVGQALADSTRGLELKSPLDGPAPLNRTYTAGHTDTLPMLYKDDVQIGSSLQEISDQSLPSGVATY